MAFSSLTKGQLLSDVIVVDNSVMMRWLFNLEKSVERGIIVKDIGFTVL